MITRLDLHHFKCFETLLLPLGHLTLLSGTNASGKSSVLQALVLLHQTMREHEWSNRLMLNGGDIRLGTVSDVVDQVYGRDTLGIGLHGDAHNWTWTFEGGRTELSMAVNHIVIDDLTAPSLPLRPLERPEQLRLLLPTDIAKYPMAIHVRDLTYITAERLGPREIYPLEDPQVATVVGRNGEHTASVLDHRRYDSVSPDLVLPDTPPTLLRQVEERMRLFFPGCGLVVQQVPQINAVTLRLRTSSDTDFHRPINVGFGLTQVLPIIVAALAARRGEIILIENPEVHLHPAGQALMGQFLGDVAQAGIQVIVETHSDHVLNGIRRSVKAGRLLPEQVALHFFRSRSIGGAQVVSPQLDTSGNVDVWPEGFFDQFDKDSSYFAGWGE